jgi:hypothetical protein
MAAASGASPRPAAISDRLAALRQRQPAEASPQRLPPPGR